MRDYLISTLVAIGMHAIMFAQGSPKLELVLQTTWHASRVESVALSSDGKYAGTTGGRTAFLWDVATGKKLRTFKGHTSWVTTVALSGDGKHVVTASDDSTAVLWDAASGKKLHTFVHDKQDSTNPPPFGTPRIYDMALSADGRYIVTGSWQIATLWDVRTGKKLRAFKVSDTWVESVAVSGDGKFVLTAPWDKTAFLWESATGKKLQTFQGDSGRIRRLAMSNDGKHVVTMGDQRFSKGKQFFVWPNREVVVWDSATGNKLHTIDMHKSHTRDISRVALTSDGKHILTTSWDTTAILWEVETGKPVRTFKGHTGDVVALALAANGRRAITGSADDSAVVWDVASGARLQSLRGPADKVAALALSGDGSSLAVAGIGVSLWSLADGKKVRYLRGRMPFFDTVALSADGKHVVAGSKSEEAILWDAMNGKQLRTYPGFDSYFRPRVCVAITADAQRVAVLSLGSTHLWDVVRGNRLTTVVHPDEAQAAKGWYMLYRSNSAAMSGDGRLLALGGAKSASLWDLASGRKLHTFEGHTESVDTVALSSDARLVLTGSEDKSACLWDAANGKKLRTFAGHKGAVATVALSADGKLAVTGSRNKIALWDASSGDKLRVLEGHTGDIRDMALSRDGKHLWTTSADRSVRLWDTATGKERCRIYSLNMAEDWLVVTADGRFDGSKNAWRFVAYREPGTTKLHFDDATLKRFHRPGLLAQIYKGTP